MKKIILIRYGEIALKGLNKPVFEEKLMKNAKKMLYGLGKIEIKKSQSRVYLTPKDDNYDFDTALKRLTRVFGIVSVSPVWQIETDFDAIKINVLKMVEESLKSNIYKTFKVEAKRGDKTFPLKSPEICREIGGFILDEFSQLSVDVNNPDFTVFIEVRENTYIYSEIIPAQGGMPLGTNGKAMLLLSGGIDSPVAGWMVAKRGVELELVHFYSYPYTSERAKEKVIDLAKVLSTYCHRIKLHVVHFTDIQLKINEVCPQDQTTVLMRRLMMKITERLAQRNGSMALVTGECVGQVASQTMHALQVTNQAVDMPVLRPLIGMDKNEVIQIARKIGTFEISILPYEDCCTVFVAKHPKTKPQLEKILSFENALDLEQMIESAINGIETIEIVP